VAGCFKQINTIFGLVKCGGFYCDSRVSGSWVETRPLPARKCVDVLLVHHMNCMLRMNEQIIKPLFLVFYDRNKPLVILSSNILHTKNTLKFMQSLIS
jgi:hypothetical protein